jgi:nicotinate-nucleotide pyrophosphorylase (carboxylating)
MVMDEIDIYLKEDLGDKGDITSDNLFSNELAKANIIAHEDCVVAGLKEAVDVFERTGATTTLKIEDGEFIKKATIVVEITGSARSILKAERLVLNIIGRMSGIATETKELVEKCKAINQKVTVAATRKTTPGFRKFEKRAVEIAGGESHRYGLFDAIMIKDNHIKIAGSVDKAIQKINEKLGNKKIEIEVENKDDALTAARYDVDFIMLDNFDPKSAEALTGKIKKINPNIKIEISGGVTKENITDYASFADRISLGYITHSAKNKDFSLEFI